MSVLRRGSCCIFSSTPRRNRALELVASQPPTAGVSKAKDKEMMIAMLVDEAGLAVLGDSQRFGVAL